MNEGQLEIFLSIYTSTAAQFVCTVVTDASACFHDMHPEFALMTRRFKRTRFTSECIIECGEASNPLMLLYVIFCSVKMACIYHSTAEQALMHLATQASQFFERLHPAGRLTEVHNHHVRLLPAQARDVNRCVAYAPQQQLLPVRSTCLRITRQKPLASAGIMGLKKEK